MTDLLTLLEEPPASTGVLVDSSGTRFHVEMMLPDEAGAIVGTAVVGTTKVAGGLAWIDLTPYVAGCTWTRGAGLIGEPPDVGTATITLESAAHIFAPWRTDLAAFHGSGLRFASPAVIRISMTDPADPADIWYPRFTGIVDTWTEQAVEGDAAVIATVELVEPVALAAYQDFDRSFIDDYPGLPALSLDIVLSHYGALIGFGFENLSGVAGGFPDDAPSPDGTLMALLQTICAEYRIWLTSDAKGKTVTVRGVPVLYLPSPPWPLTAFADPDPNPAPTITIDYDDLDHDAATPSTDAERVLNHATITDRADNVSEWSDDASIARYGKRSYTETLIWNTVAESDFFASIIIKDYGYLDKIVDPIRLDAAQHLATLKVVDPRSPFTITGQPATSPVGFAATGHVRRTTFNVTARHANALNLECWLGLDIFELETTS